jgi:hypothetical protein
MPIRVVSCCGNYFGKNCLKRWYREIRTSKKLCPLCKRRPREEFLDKLLNWGDSEAEHTTSPAELLEEEVAMELS